MKKRDLMNLIADLPENAEITILVGDDILGDYAFETDLTIEEDEGRQYKSTIYATFGNYGSGSDPVKKVWVIRAG